MKATFIAVLALLRSYCKHAEEVCVTMLPSVLLLCSTVQKRRHHCSNIIPQKTSTGLQRNTILCYTIVRVVIQWWSPQKRAEWNDLAGEKQIKSCATMVKCECAVTLRVFNSTHNWMAAIARLCTDLCNVNIWKHRNWGHSLEWRTFGEDEAAASAHSLL